MKIYHWNKLLVYTMYIVYYVAFPAFIIWSFFYLFTTPINLLPKQQVSTGFSIFGLFSLCIILWVVYKKWGRENTKKTIPEYEKYKECLDGIGSRILWVITLSGVLAFLLYQYPEVYFLIDKYDSLWATNIPLKYSMGLLLFGAIISYIFTNRIPATIVVLILMALDFVTATHEEWLVFKITL
jgi:hypothetical protein